MILWDPDGAARDGAGWLLLDGAGPGVRFATIEDLAAWLGLSEAELRLVYTVTDCQSLTGCQDLERVECPE